jgi:hypothetical protein
MFVQYRTAAVFLLEVNISYGFPFLVFCEYLVYIRIHFSLTKVFFFVLSLYLVLSCSSRSYAETQLTISLILFRLYLLHLSFKNQNLMLRFLKF